MVNNDEQPWHGNFTRRQFVSSVGTTSLLTALAGCSGSSQDNTTTANTTATATSAETTSGSTENAPQPGPRITNARRVGPRDVNEYNYHLLWSYRKRKSLETLLADPRVNEIASNWIASFEAYDPLTNYLDSVSVQGTTDMTVEGGIESGTFNVTAANRQVAYGLVDRRTDELVAMHVTDPLDVTWERSFGQPPGRKRHEFVLNKDRVWQHLEGNEWYPIVKVAEIITSYSEYPHGAVTPAAYFVKEDGQLSIVSCFLKVSDPENLELLDVTKVERFVENPPQEYARRISTTGDTQLGAIPSIPMDKRPQITGPQGFHNIEQIPENITQANWDVSWTPPETMGAEVTANYKGKPVFAKAAPYVTYTGYDLPPRNRQSTVDWLFPEDNSVFSGELLYYDIHSSSFGGPGMLSYQEYPSTGRHPEGFRIRTHFHTGALPNAIDFHSGHRFGPYNYYMSYDFYEDGVFMPVWQRQGPGYVPEFLYDREREHNGPLQFYTSGWLLDVTPGTTDGVETKLFNGNSWQTPENEFYTVGNEEMMVRFTNPNGSETIDIPLDDTKEIAIVRQQSGEIGEAMRVTDTQAELNFYHPEQYVDGQPIQGERVFAWLLMEAPAYELPHSSGVTSYTTFGELNLQGY